MNTQDSGDRRPNVVYVTVDSLRADHVGFLGYDRPTTPALDALADSGTVFARAYAAGIPTYYSFRSLLAGVPALVDDDIGMPASATTLAEAFRAAGYRTAGFNAGNPWLTRDYGYDRGFDTFRDFLTDGDGAAADRSRFWTVTRRARDLLSRSPPLEDAAGLAARTFCAVTGRTPLESAETMTDAASAWLAETSDDDRPFFLWVHYMDPHYPWVPRERDIEPFRPGGVSDLRVARLWHAVSHLNHGDSEHTVSAADLDRITDLYDAEVRRTDEAVGRLLAGLDTGPDGDTLVALVGDHGTELADHGGFSHGPRKLYDEVVRVPLLVAGPAVPAAREERAVSLLDVPTTLCRAAGVEPPESTLAFGTGSLLADPTTGGPVPRSPAVTEVVFDFDPVTGANADNGHLTAVVDWPWKLVVNAERGTHELYHLGADPEERTDRAEEKPFVVDALLDVVDRHRDRVVAGARSTAARVAEPDRAEATDVSARLESLGYL